MSNDVSFEEAKDGLESLGQWMECRYHMRFIGLPIQKWKMPRKEKAFFTCYVMNLVLESDGFDSLVHQKTEDVEAFIGILRRLGAKKTLAFVQNTLLALRNKTPCDEDKCTSDYYTMFQRDKVWLKLLDLVGRTIYVRYLRRAQEIDGAGKNIFNPQEWQD